MMKLFKRKPKLKILGEWDDPDPMHNEYFSSLIKIYERDANIASKTQRKYIIDSARSPDAQFPILSQWLKEKGIRFYNPIWSYAIYLVFDTEELKAKFIRDCEEIELIDQLTY